MPAFELITEIDAPPAAVFDLSLSVDAHTASMGSSKERAIAGVTEGMLGAGESVTWQARHFGLPFRMTSTITTWDRPHAFVDEQTKGPFRYWQHKHRFEPLDGGRTRMVDSISFASPLGPLGRIVDAVLLDDYMRKLVERRNQWLRGTLESGRRTV